MIKIKTVKVETVVVINGTGKGVVFEDINGTRYLYSHMMPTENYPKNMKRIR